MSDLQLHLKIVGATLILLALAHLFFPRRFGWQQDMAQLVPLNRQIFFVHFIFIVLVVAMFGVLSLVFTEHLLSPGPLARVVLWGLLIFWGMRLFAQHFIYDRALWKGHRFNTVMHILFTLLWSYYVFVYGAALVWHYK